ncbi:aminopeptidase [Cohnella nanjingensis]|uniref:Aminopeptidase n=1 Tax=Cohnella nanjingensis TaxID=1387779 RepID=A0A7X0RZR3_9BACL|nr:aminopeptidase [Cohnella nanjingensis]MBB6675285.1 aminopeptidase [Cohnella nanjingensis]
MSEFEKQLQRYAKLIVHVGVNVQPGQEVFISSQIETAPLARIVVAEAYEAGASNVHVDWLDDTVTRLRYERAADDVFRVFPAWETAKRNALVEREACFISFVSSNPDLLKGIDPERIGNYQKAAGAGLELFRRAVQSDQVSWSVVAAPSRAWAAKVFPDVSVDEAVDRLWQAIFDAVRLRAEDPVEAWRRHNDTLHAKVDVLNANNFQKLHYRAPGTDLAIELHEKHRWVGASSERPNGVPFMANLPTEEVFTVPLKDGVNGYVSSTKPLSYGGNLIDGFKITFANGRIERVEAEQGQAILEKLVEADEGSHYLGEVALVPHRSPISESNILFYNTLFDENASNHLAIGSGYAFNIEGGKTMSPEQLAAHGVNASVTHVDFMIGSAEMDIDGIRRDGTVVPIFRAGNWAI